MPDDCSCGTICNAKTQGTPSRCPRSGRAYPDQTEAPVPARECNACISPDTCWVVRQCYLSASDVADERPAGWVGPSDHHFDAEAVPSILDEAEKLVNGQRAKDYGPADENLRLIGEAWGAILLRPVSAREVALCMVGLKLVREAHRPKRDNLVDAAGYLRLIERLDN